MSLTALNAAPNDLKRFLFVPATLNKRFSVPHNDRPYRAPLEHHGIISGSVLMNLRHDSIKITYAFRIR